jgi:hypothetical protein
MDKELVTLMLLARVVVLPALMVRLLNPVAVLPPINCDVPLKVTVLFELEPA